jgi:hypothetical protein
MLWTASRCIHVFQPKDAPASTEASTQHLHEGSFLARRRSPFEVGGGCMADGRGPTCCIAQIPSLALVAAQHSIAFQFLVHLFRDLERSKHSPKA